MILIAAARSRIANIEPRYSDILTELEKEHRLLDRIDLKIKTRERERGREGEREGGRKRERNFAKRQEGRIARKAMRDLFRAY